MEITKIGKKGILLKDKEIEVLIASESISKESIYDLVISTVEQGREGGKFQVCTPGEYEVRGVLANAYSSDIESGNINITEIIFSNVTVVYVFASFEFNESVINQLGSVDVLLVECDNSKSDIGKLISKMDPEILIPIGDEDNTKSTLEKVGITRFEETKKVKFKNDSFGLDSFILQTYIFQTK